MAQFAVDEIVLPSGPYSGHRFRLDRQPFTHLWFDQIDGGQFRRYVITGPSQSGKTLIGSAIPICYHLFEIGEWVVFGVPDFDMVRDKWESDLLPTIERTRYRELLPRGGGSSRGGATKAIRFGNGAILRFMTAGGRDKSRAAFPARVLVVTEVDGWLSTRTSLEPDKIKQLEARLRAYGERSRVYLECTVTIESGRIWSEYLAGTASRIACLCPHCRRRVFPEREHLYGWREANSVVEARQTAFFACPACGQAWSENDRRQANIDAILVHRGQEITEDGRVVGMMAPTDAFSFRWSAANNLFVTAGNLGADEWLGARSRDRDNAERELCQFIWCIPHELPEIDLDPLDSEEVAKRTTGLKKGIVPAGCVGISVGIDTGKRALHWTAIAWMMDGRGQIIDYGIQAVDAIRLGTRQALLLALGELQNYFTRGWQGEDGRVSEPQQIWIDSGWHEHTDAVYEFCIKANSTTRLGQECYRPAKGYGEGERFAAHYLAPRQTKGDVCWVGREYHITRLKRARQLLVHINADHWKSELRQRLAIPPGEKLALVLYQSAGKLEHADWIDQVLAEEPKESLDSNNRPVVVWERIRRKNHFLDSSYYAVAAGDFLLTIKKQHITRNQSEEQKREKQSGQFAALDGRPFLITERTW